MKNDAPGSRHKKALRRVTLEAAPPKPVYGEMHAGRNLVIEKDEPPMNQLASDVFDATNDLAQLLTKEILDTEESASMITIIRSFSQCLDYIAGVARLVGKLLSSDTTMDQIVAANFLAKLKGEDEVPLRWIVSILAENDDVLCRRLVAETLGYLGPAGGIMLPSALRHTDEKVRHFGLMAARRLGPDADEAVHNLIEILCQEEGPESDEIPQIYFRMDACDALREIGPAAVEAVPHLMNVIIETEDSDEDQRWLQLRAAHAVFAITGDPDPCITVALLILNDVPPDATFVLEDGTPSEDDLMFWLRCIACDVLALIGPSAKAAAPGLKQCLGEERNEKVRIAIQKAIVKIEPKPPETQLRTKTPETQLGPPPKQIDEFTPPDDVLAYLKGVPQPPKEKGD